jgi:hypothetical protein
MEFMTEKTLRVPFRPGRTVESRLDQRLASYGAMSLAIVAASAVGTQAARANTISEFPVNPPLSTATSLSGALFFDVTTGQVQTHSFSGNNFGLFHVSGQALVANFGDSILEAPAGTAGLLPAALNSGVLIGTAGQVAGTGPGGLQFATNQILASSGGKGLWLDTQPHYLGLKFDVSGNTRYGWAQISVGSDFQITLRGMAYDTTGAAIPAGAGAIPEPSSALLMALGAAGLLVYRQRKKTRG